MSQMMMAVCRASQVAGRNCTLNEPSACLMRDRAVNTSVDGESSARHVGKRPGPLPAKARPQTTIAKMIVRSTGRWGWIIAAVLDSPGKARSARDLRPMGRAATILHAGLSQGNPPTMRKKSDWFVCQHGQDGHATELGGCLKHPWR